ncbi:MAG: hypothetical protein ACYDG5_03610, partial [Dehalococcoidales bacterium]
LEQAKETTAVKAEGATEEELLAAVREVAEKTPEELLAELEPLELIGEPAEEEAEEKEEEEVEAEPVAAEIIMPSQIKMDAGAGKTKLRFAEDILAPRRVKEAEKPTRAKAKKKKKGSYTKDTAEDNAKTKRARNRDYTIEEDEEYL